MKKKYNLFRPLLLSRHPSHSCLRAKNKNLPLLPYRSVIRLGSTTVLEDDDKRIQINTVQAVKNSASKLLMKQCFTEAGVRTATWCKGSEFNIDNFQYPIVLKSHYGSKGKGNSLIHNEEEFNQWKIGKNINNYIVEQFVNYGYEYRLHITEEGCFYTCRKALKQGVDEKDKWRRHDDNSVWYLEENENFHKPNSWNKIVEDCVKALKAIGADILSFDVKVQTPFDKNGNPRDYQDYILLECNSASSMDNGTGELSICAKKYIEIIPKLIINKANK